MKKARKNHIILYGLSQLVVYLDRLVVHFKHRSGIGVWIDGSGFLMPRLTIRLFGILSADLNGKPVAFAYGKTKAILAFLAADPGKTVSREKLSGLLWPDQSQEIALDNLRQALSRLRKSLDDPSISLPFLLADRDRVQLNPQADLQVDTLLFEEEMAFSSGHVHRHSQSCPTCAKHFEAACNFYRGEFLEDFTVPDSDLFSEWITVQRAHFHHMALGALGWLADYYYRFGDQPRALDFARRQVALEPLNEESNLRMMKALVQSSKLDQALSHYRQFQRVYEEEIGPISSRQLIQYYERIRSGEDVLDLNLKNAVLEMPAPLNPIIGRQVELNELEVWLADPTRRLITILGPGGIGKTRLAMEIADKQAHAFADGLIFVNLSNADDQANPAAHVARHAHLSFENDQDMLEGVARYLREKDLLVILDGVERSKDARSFVNWLLQSAPDLVILATSRERLNLPGEWVFALGGLAVPPPEMDVDIEKYSAVEMFVLHARQLDPGFELTLTNQAAVGRICGIVDGMPLAIRLASTWARTLPCAEIAQELQHSLDLLSIGGLLPEDQSTSMRAAFDQSWHRLSEEEKRVFRQIIVFKGGFDRQAAGSVCGATLGLLTSLVDKSFLLGSPEGRYEVHDLLHQYGIEKLSEAGETEQTRQRHFEYFLRMAEQNEASLQGSNSFKAFFWLVKEQSNLRAAYEWAAEGNPPRNPEDAQRLANCMHLELHKAGVHVKDYWDRYSGK